MKNHNNLQETQVPMASYARVLTGTDKPTEEPNPYECQIGGFDADGRVSFSEPYTFTQCGTTYNYQTVIVDGGKEVATLEEIQPWPIFEEMRVRYIVPLSEDEAKKNYANTRTSASATTKTQNLGLKLCKTLSTTL